MTGIPRCTQNNVNPPTQLRRLYGAVSSLGIDARKQSTLKQLTIENNAFAYKI